MPADTRSTRKAKHSDGGKQKGKCYPSEKGSENASASKRSIRETSLKKNGSPSSSNTLRSERLKNGNYKPPNPSPLRRSERAKSMSNSGKSDSSLSLMDATHNSIKRKKTVNEPVIEANHVDQHLRTESNSSRQRKKTMPAHRYRDFFRAPTKKVKASDSANKRRVGPCTSSNSADCSKKISVADKDDLNEEGKCAEDYADSTSKSDQGGLDNTLQGAASEKPTGQNNLELHPQQNPLKASAEVSVTCSKRKRVDGHLPETNSFQDTCASSIQERNRKRVQHYGEASDTNAQIDDTVKRQKKNGNTNVEPCSPRVSKDVEKESVSGSYGISSKNGPETSPNSGGSTASAQKIHAAISSDKLCAEQKDLHQILKPDMERLFQILNLKEDVQQKAEQFLVYILANQRVVRESQQLQAFLISVCWVAASILKERLDHVESLSLAREHLNFNCEIDDAEFIFTKMQFSMKMFLRSEGFNVSIHKQKLIHEGFDIEGGGEKLSEEKEHKKSWQEMKAKLEDKFKRESAVIRYINSSEAVRIDKLKILEAKHRQKLEELESERHLVEKEAEEEGIHKMNECKSWTENGLLDNIPTKVAEVVPAKSFSLSKNNPEEENIKEHGSVGVHVPLLQPPKNSGSAEVAAIPVNREKDINCNDGDVSKSTTTTQVNNEARIIVNVGEGALDSLGVQGIQVSSTIAADKVERIATSKNDPLSTENPTLQKVADANEENTAARMEQHDEASSSTHIESMNSPSTVSPSLAQPVLNMEHQVDSVPVSQEHAASHARLNPLDNEDIHAETSRDILPSSDHSDVIPCNTSEQAVYIHLPPEPAIPLDTTVSHPVDLATQPCSTSCGVPETLQTGSRIPCRTLEAPIQEHHRPPLNRSVLDAYPPLHNSNQFQNYMPPRSLPSSSLPASLEFDPLQNEYERTFGYSNQISRNHEDMVSHLKSQCDKEIEDLVGQIHRKYESMLHEGEASFLQKKRELEHNQLKVAMNMKLAEAFRSKFIDHRTTRQQVVASNLRQQQVFDSHQFYNSTSQTVAMELDRV